MGVEEKEEFNFNTLRKLLHDEKEAGNRLVSLPDDLQLRVAKCIAKFNSDLEKGMDLEALRARENFKSAFRELVTLRLRKIVQRASYADLGTDNGDMKPDDLEVYEKVISFVEARKQRLADVLEGRVQQIQRNKKVRILKDIPQYIGSDKGAYGPFRKDEVLELPDAELEWLVKNGFAESL